MTTQLARLARRGTAKDRDVRRLSAVTARLGAGARVGTPPLRAPVVCVVGDEACAVAANGAQGGERAVKRGEARVVARHSRGVALLLDDREQLGLAWLGLGVG